MHFQQSNPGDAKAFEQLTDEARYKLVASSPLRICRDKYPKVVNHIEDCGGLVEFWHILDIIRLPISRII